MFSKSISNIQSLQTACTNSSKCYMVKSTPVARNFYYARCGNNACDNSSMNRRLEQFKNYKAVDKGYCTMLQYDYDGNNNHVELALGSENYGSDCLYYNVGFRATIRFEQMVSKFSGSNYQVNDEIKFKIVSVIYDAESNPRGGNSSKQSVFITDLGVYKDFCKVNGVKKSCENSKVSPGGSYDVEIGAMSSKAHYDAILTHALTDSISPVRTKNIFINGEGADFYILDSTNSVQTYSVSGTKDAIYGGSFNDVMFKLSAQVGSDNYLRPSNVSSGNYWTFANYLHMDGSFTLKGIMQSIQSKSCTDLGLSSADKISKNSNCGEAGVTFDECNSATFTVIGKIYYPSGAPNACSSGGKVDIPSDGSKTYYVPINVSTKILIRQTATFKFGNVFEKELVYAGKGFSLDETTYSNTIRWYNANFYTKDGSPAYTYSGSDYVLTSSSSCGSSTINFDDEKIVYYIGEDGTYKSASLKDAAREVINIRMKEKIEDKKEETLSNMKFMSCDSNDSEGCSADNPNKEVSGSWSQNGVTSSRTINERINNINWVGGEIASSYKYILSSSVVVVKGENAGEVEYITDSSKNTESYAIKTSTSKYFVAFNYSSENSVRKYFPFDLTKNVNPSFLAGSPNANDWNWVLNGICNINVQDSYIDSKTGELLVEYRPIAVDNPFPKGIVPLNWQTWYQQSGNKNRIKQSYQYKPLYEITLSKFKSNDSRVSISDINSIDRFYSDISNVEKDGSNSFVSKYFNSSVSKKSYCPLGKISDDCDEAHE